MGCGYSSALTTLPEIHQKVLLQTDANAETAVKPLPAKIDVSADSDPSKSFQKLSIKPKVAVVLDFADVAKQVSHAKYRRLRTTSNWLLRRLQAIAAESNVLPSVRPRKVHITSDVNTIGVNPAAEQDAANRVPRLNKMITERLSDLPAAEGKVAVEYVWLGNLGPVGEDMRCKSRTMDKAPSSVADLPDWNFDGSSTGQAPGHDSEVLIRPQRLYRDPFRGGNNCIVLCDCYTPAGEAIPTNTRAHCARVMSSVAHLHPWFGLEQEYCIMTTDHQPVGWPRGGYPAPQGPYYCSVGTDKAFCRDIVEAHYRACLYAGVMISGINGEVLPGQWEFQVGPAEGVRAGDDLVMARFLLHRIAEEYGFVISFDPKPVPGEWNGTGCHTNVSTEPMRKPGGFEVIKAALEKLSTKHDEHIALYGQGNERRLTGKHETAPISEFRWGVADRGASIRVPRSTAADGFGYFEDRRPASNMDPYLVTAKIMKTICSVE
mmetsp:Transcript_19154/g.31344  ORF Transcript_19154/g.31344 Transcript_19154/m.31344 type:complete len:490 (-) Transcript_19154:239-1708(-)